MYIYVCNIFICVYINIYFNKHIYIYRIYSMCVYGMGENAAHVLYMHTYLSLCV